MERGTYVWLMIWAWRTDRSKTKKVHKVTGPWEMGTSPAFGVWAVYIQMNLKE